MRSLQQLGFFRFGEGSQAALREDMRVLALFRNRAELKKAYAALQDEIFRLKDLLKQQEAATQRAQDMMSALEERLGAADTAYPALVFYQLRRLWQSGHELLTQFVADLARQQEDRERRIHLAQHNSRQFARRDAAANELRSAQAQHLEASAHVSALESERGALRRWWHYFKRRALERRVTAAQVALAAAQATLAAAQESLACVESEAVPEFPGLSLEARRAINLAAIAYAEVLCQRLTVLKTPLISLAREATAHREAGPCYGPPRQCVLLMEEIGRALQLLGERGGLSEEIRARSARLKTLVRYRSATDSTPAAESLLFSSGEAVAVGTLAVSAAPLPNVLSDDIWDLFRVLR